VMRNEAQDTRHKEQPAQMSSFKVPRKQQPSETELHIRTNLIGRFDGRFDVS
jgi:hypothetical protein